MFEAYTCEFKYNATEAKVSIKVTLSGTQKLNAKT